jgi:hypothetical protein
MTKKTIIEPGMKVAVRRGVLEHIGVVLRLEDEHVIVRWTQSEWSELEFRVHRDDVKPLRGLGNGLMPP